MKNTIITLLAIMFSFAVNAQEPEKKKETKQDTSGKNKKEPLINLVFRLKANLNQSPMQKTLSLLLRMIKRRRKKVMTLRSQNKINPRQLAGVFSYLILK
jgi:hypothetical protein